MYNLILFYLFFVYLLAYVRMMVSVMSLIKLAESMSALTALSVNYLALVLNSKVLPKILNLSDSNISKQPERK